MKLSFIILNYKSPHHLRICLEHIQKLQLPFAHETIVVDNASGDDVAEWVPRLFPEATFIQNATNIGHAAGNNVGIRAASGEYVLLTNPDILYKSSEDILQIVEYLDTHADVGILGPKLHNPNGTMQYSCYRKYSIFTPLYRRTFLGKFRFAKRDIARHLMADFDHQSTREVDWVLGACMLIRRKTLEIIGLLDESFFLYFADYEICDRARHFGNKVIYYAGTRQIIHYHKRESVTSRFTVLQTISYLTRIHIRDWMIYLRAEKRYDQYSNELSRRNHE